MCISYLTVAYYKPSQSLVIGNVSVDTVANIIVIVPGTKALNISDTTAISHISEIETGTFSHASQ